MGRLDELRCIERVLDDLDRGRPGAIELVGEPGIGKTRLLKEIGLRAEQRAHLVLSDSKRWTVDRICCRWYVRTRSRPRLRSCIPPATTAAPGCGSSEQWTTGALDDRAGLGSALGYYGRAIVLTAQTADEYERGKACMEEAIAISRETGRLWWAAWNMQHLGASAREHAQLELAARTLEEGEAILTQIGESHAHSHLIAFRGAVLCDQGDFDRDQQLIEQSLAASRAIDCEDGAAVALYLLAGVTDRQLAAHI